MDEPRGEKITDPTLLAWCDFARKCDERGFPIAIGDQWLSTSSFTAGAAYGRQEERGQFLKLAKEVLAEWDHLDNGKQALSEFIRRAEALKQA